MYIIGFSEGDLERCKFIITLCDGNKMALRVLTANSNQNPILPDIELFKCYRDVTFGTMTESHQGLNPFTNEKTKFSAEDRLWLCIRESLINIEDSVSEFYFVVLMRCFLSPIQEKGACDERQHNYSVTVQIIKG